MHAQAQILIVEDDVRLAELMADYLRTQGLQVSVTDRGEGVLALVQQTAPDLLVLDIGLPGQDGFAVCKALRPTYSFPILMLTARDNNIDHVLGLELGADDYVIKPVEPRVLLARIHALLRRGTQWSKSERLQFGRLQIDLAARTVLLDNDDVHLSTNEFDLLACLATRAGKVQSREALYRQIYSREYDGLDRTLDVRISQLRKKLGDAGDKRLKTIWGQGYLFVDAAW
jgi:DNA-binding response OmpR family regulator